MKGASMRGMAAVVDELFIDDIVDSPDVARVTGTSPRSVTRWLEGASPRRPAEERLLELKAVIDVLRRVMRDEPARLWIRSPNPELDYEKPLDLIERGEYRRVIGALRALAEGVTAWRAVPSRRDGNRSPCHLHRRTLSTHGGSVGRTAERRRCAHPRRPIQ